tara:strand:+ start:383 stop:571 length:189 start_codon:yes stop_codon:yes gene_type:complete
MTAKETVKSWKWRIPKAGFNQTNFSEAHKLGRSNLNDYINGRVNPTIDTFDKIEGILTELGV